MACVTSQWAEFVFRVVKRVPPPFISCGADEIVVLPRDLEPICIYRSGAAASFIQQIQAMQSFREGQVTVVLFARFVNL